MNLDQHPHTKINSLFIIVLRLWATIISCLEENKKENLHEAGIGSGFLSNPRKG